MRLDPRQYDSSWDVATFVERDSETQIYFKPPPEPEPVLAPVAAPPALMPNVRTYEVTDRFQMPVMAQRPSPFRVERTQRARRVPRSMVGLGFAVVCVLVGIAMGGAIAVGTSSWRANAAPAVVVAPIKMTATPPTAPVPAPPPAPIEKPAPIVTPIEQLPPPQPTLPTPPVALEPPPAPVPPPVAEPAPAPAPQPAPAPRHHHAASAPAKHAGAGTLAVSSKPPCAIVIDGKATDLTSPQRAIALSAGTHEVTLINAEEGIHLTAEVVISADRTTQLIQDFTK